MQQMDNGIVRLGIDDQGRPAALERPDAGISIPIDPAALSPLWALTLRDANGNFRHVLPSGAPDMQQAEKDGTHTLQMTWDVETEWGRLGVTAFVTLRNHEPTSDWHLSVINHTDCALWEISFPRLSGLTRFDEDGGTDWLAAPFTVGELVPDPVDKVNHHRRRISHDSRLEYGAFDVEQEKSLAYSYPGMWTMQFLAYGQPQSGGLYYAAHDGQALYKRFGMYADGDDERHALCTVKQYPYDRLAAGEDFQSFYPVVVGVYPGGWWNASAMYRTWALKQFWTAKGPVRDRTDIPEWSKALDVWYWNWQFNTSGHPSQINPAIRYFKEQTGCEMALHWYGSNGEVFGSNWRIPEIYPDNPDIRRQVIEGCRELHGMNVKCIPYVNARAWAPYTAASRKESFMQNIVRDDRGEPADPKPLGRFTICPTETPNHERMRRIVNQMIDGCEMDGAYLDVITSSYAVPCFDGGHDHPAGGHDHWCRGYRDMLEKIQADIKERSPDNFITSESVIECFQDLTDLDLARAVTNITGHIGIMDALPIPMFHSVYHDYHMTYGTVSTFKKENKPSFAFCEALCFVAGQQLMISGFFAGDQDKEIYQPELQYIMMLARAHKAARKWLNLGVWMPPLDIVCDRVDITYHPERPPKPDMPSVVNGCFNLDGELCMALVNHTDKAQDVAFTIDPAVYGLGDRPRTLSVLHPEPEDLGELSSDGPSEHSMTVEPRSCRILVAS